MRGTVITAGKMETLYTNNEENSNSNYWGENGNFITHIMRKTIITRGKNRNGGKQKIPAGKRGVKEQLMVLDFLQGESGL